LTYDSSHFHYLHSSPHSLPIKICIDPKHMWRFLIYINEVDLHAKCIEHVPIYINEIDLEVKCIRHFLIYINKIDIDLKYIRHYPIFMNKT
jgi:hypothetical protein